MSTRISLRRKNRLNLFREAEKLASFDEFPVLRPEVDPQIHLSRNTIDQPFYLICEKDTVIALWSGAARVLFRDENVLHHDLIEGDFVYVPAGTPHRIITTEPHHLLRYKATRPGREAVVWYCGSCQSELDYMVGDASARPCQEIYQAACERHNAEPDRRSCKTCGAAAPAIDLSPFRWTAVAQAVAEDADEA